MFLVVVILGAADALLHVDIDLKKIAARVLERAKEICTAKSVIELRIIYLYVYN